MKKRKTALVFIIAIFLSISVYGAGSGTPKKNAKGWRKVIWVDEKGVRHVTLVSPRVESETSTETAARAKKTLPEVMSAKVQSVVGIEKIKLADGRLVRYIGVKGPAKTESIYKKALAFHTKMVKGKWVNILPGVESHAPDGSIWGFVFVNRMTFVNAELIRHGYVRAEPIEPNVEYRVLFGHLQNRASSRKLGIWRK